VNNPIVQPTTYLLFLNIFFPISISGIIDCCIDRPILVVEFQY